MRELFQDLAVLVEEQQVASYDLFFFHEVNVAFYFAVLFQVEVDRIRDNVDHAHAKTEHALGQIVEAQQLQREGCIIS